MVTLQPFAKEPFRNFYVNKEIRTKKQEIQTGKTN